MAKITKISPQVKREGYYNLYVDEKFFGSLSELELSTANLHIGDELTSVELKDLLERTQASKAYARSLRYLGLRPRSEYELRVYLKRKGHEPKLIEATIKQLYDYKYLDDANFARLWIENRNLLKPSSSKKLFLELRQKGIAEPLIREALDNLDEDAELKTLKQIIYKKKSRYADRLKLIKYLLSQGFRYSDIHKALDEAEPDN